MLRKALVLSEQGYRTFWHGVAACVVSNLVLMGTMVIVFAALDGFLGHLQTGAPLPPLGPNLAAIAAALALMTVTQVWQYRTTYGAVYAESERSRTAMAERIRRLPLSFFGQRDLADFASVVMKDCADHERLFSHSIPRLFGMGIFVAIMAVAMFAFDARLAAAALWPIPAAAAVLLVSWRVQIGHTRAKSAAALAFSDTLQEFMECNRQIRAANLQDSYLNLIDRRIDDVERSKQRSEAVNGTLVSAAVALCRLALPSTVLVGALLVAGGECSLIVYVGYLVAVTRVYEPVMAVLESIVEMIDLTHSLRRMRELIDAPIMEGSERFEPQGHDISFENVSFAYGDTAEAVLSGVSFTAHQGQVTALVGPSGGGKSTCAKLAARFWDADEGAVRVGGVNVAEVDPEALLSRYSMVFQDVVLFDGTVADNIRLGRGGATDAEVRAAARAANCEDFVNALPQGFDTMIGENGALLSGGERQRISIARALLKDAPIVLLDEATASLDVEGETAMQQALSRLLAGRTVMVIAHRMRTVMNADKVVVLSRGTVAEQGPPAQLLQQNGLFAHMVRVQAEASAWKV
ncbi:ABC transporter ATP-binding protein [Eggerthellaceae bacterium zg-997]|nr:ABC transporter ATP-binding protein [Eggerthellaceae bacterium zg-997]